MAKKKKPNTTDINVNAFEILRATVDPLPKPSNPPPDLPPFEKNPAAVALGRLGGLKGGKARAKTLSAKERAEIAKKGAAARWKGRKPPR